MAEKKSKILIIGGTGHIGKFIVEASAKSGHPTFALVRESTLSDPVKGEIVQNFRNLGVTLVHGDLYNHDSLLEAIKQVDVVISAVGLMQIADQVKIIAAIKEAGNIKRFFPSEFGNDVNEPPKPASEMKARIRTIIEAEGIPFTYVVCNSVFNKEDYIATYTIRAVDDPSALNKVLSIQGPPLNTEPDPFNFELSINHSVPVVIKGYQQCLEYLENLEKESLELCSELEEAFERLNVATEEKKKLEEEIAILEKKCSDSEAESVKHAEKVVELTDEKKKLTQDLASLRESDIMEKLKSVEDQLEHVNLKKSAAEARIAEIEKQMLEVSEKLSIKEEAGAQKVGEGISNNINNNNNNNNGRGSNNNNNNNN